MTTRTRRGFLGLPPAERKAEPAAPGFSLSRFYAKRKEAGETPTATLPEFEVAESADFGTTPVGSPDLGKRGPRKGRP